MRKLPMIRNIAVAVLFLIYLIAIVLIGNCKDLNETTANCLNQNVKYTDGNQSADNLLDEVGDNTLGKKWWKASILDYSVLNDSMQQAVNVKYEKEDEKDKDVTTPVTEKKPVQGTVSAPTKPSGSGSTLGDDNASGGNSSAGGVQEGTSSGSPTGGHTPAPNVKVPAKPENGWGTLPVYDTSQQGKRIDADAYDVVCQMVQSEMRGISDKEALKAQAIACYTFYKRQGCVQHLNLSAKVDSSIKEAVSAVDGLAMYYNNKLIYAPYFACSSGYTADNYDVYRTNVPYLKSVESVYDYKYRRFESTVEFSKERMKELIEASITVKLPDDPEKWIKISNHLSAGVVGRMFFGEQNEYCSGTYFWEKVLGHGIRSNVFSVTYKDGQFIFTTKGYGHMVGMSQIGAMYYAQLDGWNYAQILHHYYTGITISAVN